MSDPLSVAASVVGLISAAAQMIPVLYNVGTAIKDAPQLTKEAAGELANITVVLQQLQSYVTGKAQASIQRRNLITVEHITATLTGCVVTYSDLDAVLKSLHADTGMRAWDRGMWYMKKYRVNEIVGRLQNHKSTLGLMLNILQCSQLSEAETSMDRLCDTVNEVLRTNQELSDRLRNMEQFQMQQAPSAADQTSETRNDGMQASAGASDEVSTHDSTSIHSNDSNTNIPEVGPRVSSDSAPATSQQQGRPSGEQARFTHFEELLHRSRIYRNVSDSDYTPSLISDARSTLALSISSSLTLGEVSNISVYAIPVYASELSNAECYRFTLPSEPRATVADRADSIVAESTTSSTSSETPSRRSWRGVFRKSPRPKPGDADKRTSDIVPAAENRSFGVALTTSVRYANVAISLYGEDGKQYIYGYIPIVVAKCGVFLKEKGTESELIFERSGSPKSIRELCDVFDKPPRYGKGQSWEGYTVYDAASVLVRYVVQLPEPIIPRESYGAWREPLRNHQAEAVGIMEHQRPSIGEFSHEAAIEDYQRLTTELKPLHRQLFLYILDLLAVFASKSDDNKMTTTKLAGVFQPGFLALPGHSQDTVELRLSPDVLIFLIENQDSFLIGMKATAADGTVVDAWRGLGS